MGEIPADYELREPEKREPKTNTVLMALVFAGLIASLGVALFSLKTAYGANRPQATAQIHALDKSIRRQAGEIASLKIELGETSAKLTASDPASNSSLITCHDLKHMNLTETTGASIEAGGSIGLGQSHVPLPAHCPK